ncbi:MAG: hypothetical protein V1808_02280 [Candidatus Daviesbacteria bacterium]
MKILKFLFIGLVLIGLFFVPKTILADVCSQYTTCSECVAKSQSESCVWGIYSHHCAYDNDIKNMNSNVFTVSCSNDNSSQQTSSVNCQSITSCKTCLSHEECGWCYDQCVTWIGSSSSCQLHSIPSADQCPDSQAVPTTVPTVRVITSTPTPIPVSKKANGQTCKLGSDCTSGNCTNNICCLKNKTCCTQSNSCSTDQSCSTKNDRYYCIPKLENGMACTSYDQCKSKNCGKGVCCGGQPCCTKDNDCGKDEYCETKDNAYYCRTKWNVGETCEKPSACRSGYCNTYTQKCAENPKNATPIPKKAVCGDNSCDDWLGENCCNCPKDCANITDFCCDQNSKYASSKDKQNKKFNLYETTSGSVPNYRLVVPKGTDEKTFFNSYQPKICNNGKIIDGECVNSDQCVKGICVDNKCTSATSDESQAVTDKKIIEAIANEQNEYKKESVWVPVYDKIKGTILRTNKVEGGLEVRLEVQGATAGNIADVKIGGNVETRLEVVNNTAYYNAVIAGIVYKNPTQIEQKKYTLSVNHMESNSAILGMIGKAGAQRLGGKYFVLPPYYKLTIQSTVSPKQEGYLDVSGIVYYSTENMYANSSLSDQINNVPANFESNWKKIDEVTNSILVVPKKCSWGICL